MLAPGKPLKNKTSTSTNEDMDVYYKDTSGPDNRERDTNSSFLSTNSEDDDSEANFNKKEAEEEKIKNKETLDFLAKQTRMPPSQMCYPFYNGESTGSILEAIKGIQI